MVSAGNVVDDPNPPFDFIVNEEQVVDETILENRNSGQARINHIEFTKYIIMISTTTMTNNPWFLLVVDQ
jgi:hypothetical protein